MRTSIYNLYYAGFLDQFQSLLSWTRINKDIRSCYYQSSRLVTFVSDELQRFFIHQFVSSRSITRNDFDLSDAQFICRVATEFKQFTKEQQSSDNKWISTCANFLEMPSDFLELVNAYRIELAMPLLLNTAIRNTHRYGKPWVSTSMLMSFLHDKRPCSMTIHIRFSKR